MPFLVLVFLFVAVPVAEISLLIRVGGAIGPLNTIVFVIFTAVLGAYLVRQQGFATLAKLQEETNAGRLPAMQIAEGVALLFAGAVLLTPGFITDALGFSLLVPQIRRGIIAWFIKRGIKGQTAFTYSSTSQPAETPGNANPSTNPDVIEGEYTTPTDDHK